LPLSTSAFLTQSFRVCGAQPIFAEIDITACLRDPCCPSLSHWARTNGASIASIEDQPHGAFAHFRGKLARCLAHDAPPYSGVGASGKPGAVQTVLSSDRLLLSAS
jgi:hypothetical protein